MHQVVSWDLVVQEYMEQRRYAEAVELLDRRLALSPRDNDARFLKAMVQIAIGRSKEAVKLFRSILIDEPNALRVRLELARAHFIEKDYGNAHRQFQHVLAARPPAVVVENINEYMAQIRGSKSTSYNVAVALAPDTNLNNGSSAKEVTLFGIPFGLSNEARGVSGVGLALEAGAEWAPALDQKVRLRLGTQGERREYVGKAFDDTTVAGYVGPRWVAGKWDISVLGSGINRWYGTRSYSHAYGASAETTYHFSPRVALHGVLAGHKVDYQRAPAMSGFYISLSGATSYALDASSAIGLKSGLSRHDAKERPFSSWSGFVAAGYGRELPMGFSTYVESSYLFSDFDERMTGFSDRRTDDGVTLSVSLLNRHLVLTRFTPRITYIFTRQFSSVPLYDFKRSRLEAGFTTRF